MTGLQVIQNAVNAIHFFIPNVFIPVFTGIASRLFASLDRHGGLFLRMMGDKG